MNTLICQQPKIKTPDREKIHQYFEESESWKRLLDFISAENDYLEVRLIHLDRLGIMEKVPGKKENLQLEIQKTSQIVSLNKSAITRYEKWLTRQFVRTGEDAEQVFRRHVDVRKQIERVEINFAMQKVAFNDQLIKDL